MAFRSDMLQHASLQLMQEWNGLTEPQAKQISVTMQKEKIGENIYVNSYFITVPHITRSLG